MIEDVTMISESLVKELIKDGRAALAIRYLFMLKHPVINRLFPRLKIKFEPTSQDISLSQEEVARMEEYLQESRNSLLLISMMLVILGGAGVIFGITGIFIMINGNISESNIVISLCFGLPLGLPIFVYGLTGVIKVNQSDFGLWIDKM